MAPLAPNPRATWRTAFADLRRHHLQTVLLFVILATATLTLSLAVMVQRVTSGPFERLMEETNGAHVWFAAEPGVDLTALAEMEGVVATEGPFARGDARLAGAASNLSLNLLAQPATEPAIGRPYLTSGRWLNGPDEAVLEPEMATFLRVDLGDAIAFESPDGPVSLTVVGFALNLAGWTVEGDGVSHRPTAMVLPETFARIVPDQSSWSQTLAVRLNEPGASDAFAGTALEALGADSAVRATTWQRMSDALTADVDPMVILLGIFSAFALVAAGLVIANAIGGRVIAQFREIGLLKAVGFTPAGIVGVFVLGNLIVAMGGIAVGLAAGMLIAPLFDEEFSVLLTTTPVSRYEAGPILLVVLVVALTVIVATAIPALAGAQVPAVQAIGRGYLKVQREGSHLAHLAARVRLPATVRLGLKDAFARPLRAWVTVATLALTTITLTFSLGIDATLDDLLAHPENWGAPYDLTLERTSLSAAETEALIAANPEVDAAVGRLEIEGRVPGGPAVTAFAVSGDTAPYAASIPEGRLFVGPGEAIAGQAFLESAGLSVGDSFTLDVAGRALELRIVGRVVDVDFDGEIVLFGMETLQALDPAIQPESYLVRLRPGADTFAALQALTAAAGGGVRVSPVDLEAEDDVLRVRAILIGMNAVLIVIGVINLFSTMMLTVRERFREVGILKAIGLTPRQVQAGIYVTTGTFALLAALAGIPLGLLVTQRVFDRMGSELGVGSGIGVMPDAGLVALLVPVTLVLGLLGALLPARRAASLPVSAALRYE